MLAAGSSFKSAGNIPEYSLKYRVEKIVVKWSQENSLENGENYNS
jgi:hypothetical protein